MSQVAAWLNDSWKIPLKLRRRQVENATGMRQQLTFSELLSSLKISAPQNITSTFCRFTYETISKAEWEGPEVVISPSCVEWPGLRIASCCWQLPDEGRDDLGGRHSPLVWNEHLLAPRLCFAATLHTRLCTVKCQWRLNNSRAWGKLMPCSNSGRVQPQRLIFF